MLKMNEEQESLALKFRKLIELCSVLSSDRSFPYVADVYEYAKADAKKLVQELFPPMAKPLQFFNGRANGQYKVSCELGIWHAFKFAQKHTGCWVPLCVPVDTEEKAEQICEQHHQDQFICQLAQ